METKIKNEYKTANNELENLYRNIAIGVKIWSKCDSYQYGEKSTKYFLNLEKQKPVNGTVKEIIKNDIVSLLGNISLPVINDYFFNLYENDLTKNEFLISWKSMPNNKAPGNNGLTK